MDQQGAGLVLRLVDIQHQANARESFSEFVRRGDLQRQVIGYVKGVQVSVYGRVNHIQAPDQDESQRRIVHILPGRVPGILNVFRTELVV